MSIYLLITKITVKSKTTASFCEEVSDSHANTGGAHNNLGSSRNVAVGGPTSVNSQWSKLIVRVLFTLKFSRFPFVIVVSRSHKYSRHHWSYGFHPADAVVATNDWRRMRCGCFWKKSPCVAAKWREIFSWYQYLFLSVQLPNVSREKQGQI